jgi:hypothetical protein
MLYPQGHIREDGAYYLSVYPFLALLAAERLGRMQASRGAAASLVAALALAQGALGWRKVAEHQRGLDLEPWGAAVEAALTREPAPGPDAPRPVFFVDRLPRFDWILYRRPLGDVHDVLRALDLVPRRKHPKLIDALLGIAGEQLARGGAVYIDADLLLDPLRPPFLADFEARLRSFSVRLEPLVPSAGEPPVLYRVLVRDG